MSILTGLAELSCQSYTSILVVTVLLAILVGVIIWYIFESRKAGALSGFIALVILVASSLVPTICGILPLGTAPTQ